MKLIFLVAHQRSGTNALRSALMQSRYIEDMGEAFNPNGAKYAPNLYHFMRLDDNVRLWLPNRSEERFLKYYRHLSELADKSIGLLDAKYDMLRGFDPEARELNAAPYLFELIDRVGGGLIHLTRNPFHIYVSHRMAVETAVFHVPMEGGHALAETIAGKSLTIDIPDMLDYIGKRLAERTKIEQLTNSVSHRTTIDYDQLFSQDGSLDCAPVWNFVDLTPQPFVPQLTKSVQRPYVEIIANYDDVVAALDGAGLGGWITL